MFLGANAVRRQKEIDELSLSPCQVHSLIQITVEAYASVSGSAISGGTASEYGVEQISNMASGGYRERFSPLVDRVPTSFFR